MACFTSNSDSLMRDLSDRKALHRYSPCAVAAFRWGCPGLIARVISSRAVESGYTPGTRVLPLAAHSPHLQMTNTFERSRQIHPSAVRIFRHLECSSAPL